MVKKGDLFEDLKTHKGKCFECNENTPSFAVTLTMGAYGTTLTGP